MAQQRSAAEHSQARPRSNGEAGEREHRVQIEGQSSVTQSIAHSVVIKDGDLFFLCDPDGDVPEGQTHGLGLYYHDCRFLDEYTLRFGSVQLEPLVATAERGFEAILQLTNPDLRLSDGRLIRKQTIGVKWKRTLDGAERALQDLVTVQNFGTEPIHLPVVFDWLHHGANPQHRRHPRARHAVSPRHPPLVVDDSVVRLDDDRAAHAGARHD